MCTICAPRKTNYTQIDHSDDLDVEMSMYNLIEYSNVYSKTSGSLQQYYGNKAADGIVSSESFKSKIRITIILKIILKFKKNIEIEVPLNT